MTDFKVTTADVGIETTIYVNKVPDECPYCHMGIEPKFLKGYRRILGKPYVDVFFACTRIACQHTFLGFYQQREGEKYILSSTSKGTLKKRAFEKDISLISPRFEIIYNQALQAEENGLDEISGMGYRKACEFLIKDYLINNKSINKADVENKMLGKCIEDYISDIKIKEMAKRVAWLGNDETHYVRKFTNNDLSDLKNLIDITVYWIMVEIKSKHYTTTINKP